MRRLFPLAIVAALAASSLASIVSLSASFGGGTVHAGTCAKVRIQCDTQGAPVSATVVLGTAAGRTLVSINGTLTMVPVAGTVWVAATTTISGTASILAAVPANPALVGAHLFGAVVLVDALAQCRVAACTGGPIIEDIIN